MMILKVRPINEIKYDFSNRVRKSKIYTKQKYKRNYFKTHGDVCIIKT